MRSMFYAHQDGGEWLADRGAAVSHSEETQSPESQLADWHIFAVPAPLPDFPQELAESLQLAADPHLRHCLGPAAGQLPWGAVPPVPGSAHSRGSAPPGPAGLWGRGARRGRGREAVVAGEVTAQCPGMCPCFLCLRTFRSLCTWVFMFFFCSDYPRREMWAT